MNISRRLAYAAVLFAGLTVAAGCGESCKVNADCPKEQSCLPNQSNGVNMCCPISYLCGAQCCPPGLPPPPNADGGA